jgi:branched-chain amino acid transport system permease protein
MHAFLRTPVGRMCNAVRDNAERAEFIGYDPVRVRLVVLAVAAMFAGLAGGLHALNYEIVASEAAGAGRSGAVLLMAYIGGVANFLGAILGAVTITWLQVSLSDYTTAWQLYLGLFFVLFVLFAPRGLAGLIVMHRDVARTRAFLGLLRAYAVALVPAAVMAIGAIVFIEINYRRATQPEAGPRMALFGIDMDYSTPWPWLAAIALLAIGAWLFRASLPLVASAWERATEAARTTAGGRR